MNLLAIWRVAIALPILLLFMSLFQRTHGQCSSHQFECTNKRCVPLTWRCDEDDDCGDGSDEQKCEIRTCSGTEFKCANEKCVPSRWQCDKEDDCGDNSDEDTKYCQNKTCSSDQFMCESQAGICIPASWRCDGQEDCHDGSDEKADCFQITCTEEEFSCKNNKCIMKRWVCDQDNDCGDGSDEVNCPNVTCSGSEFMCSNGRCTPARWRCDGDIDCSDNSDEIGCPTDSFKSPCNAREFLCANRLDCIHSAWKCDGDPDCPDGSDEMNCTETCRQDQYRCKDHQCIPGNMECNGLKECKDGSDEENCPELVLKSCDPQTQFDCGRNHCIPIKLLCNGRNDCGAWEDEPQDKCFRNECLLNNGGCSQKCIDAPIGYSCECNAGFQLVDNKTCEDINECEIPGSCSQICTNIKGHYKCSCEKGYSLEPNSHHRCKAQEGHPALLFANRHDIRKINLETFEYKAVVSSLRSTVSLDYVFHTGTVVWSDVAEECIKSAPLDTGEPVTNVIDTGISTPDGIAVDWIYNHIYWTDTGKNTIGVSDMSGRLRKTLISTKLDEPRAIVVNPLEGWMFWTDWGEPSKIERAGMEGTHRETIIASDVKWPNGLAIDYVSRRIFWVDAKLHLLSSANYDGTNHRVVLSSPVVIKHPFAIDVFEDWVYWTDWESEAIHKVNKFTGEELTNIAVGIFSPMDVRVYHPYKQPEGVNYCYSMNGQCSHLCLPAPSVTADSAKFSCACPDNMTLADDHQNCINKAVPVMPGIKPSTTPQPTKLPVPATSTSLPISTRSPVTKKQNIPSSTTASTTTHLSTTVQLPVTTASKPSSSVKNTTVPSSQLPILVYNTTNAVPTVLHLETTETPKSVELSTLQPSINGTEYAKQEQASAESEGNGDADTGRIAGIIIGVLGGIAIITTVVAFLVYKQYLRRNVTSMNFDNPVYRKTTEDQFSLEKNQYQPARSYPPGLEPLTSPGTNEFV